VSHCAHFAALPDGGGADLALIQRPIGWRSRQQGNRYPPPSFAVSSLWITRSHPVYAQPTAAALDARIGITRKIRPSPIDACQLSAASTSPVSLI